MVVTARSLVLALALLLVVATLGAAPVAAQQPVEARTHEVAPGETLWSLAQRYYDNGHLWRRILEANRDRVQDPDVLSTGLVLTIPPAEGPVGAAAGAPRARVEGVEVATPRERTPETRTVLEAGEARGSRIVESRTSMWPDTTPVVDPRARAQALAPVSRDVAWSAPWVEEPHAPVPHEGLLAGFAGSEGDVSDRRTALLKDRVLLTFADGRMPAPGSLLQTFRTLRSVEGLGRIMIPTGIVRVVSREEGGAVGEVESVYDRITLGDLLRPVPDYAIMAGATARAVASDEVRQILGFARDQGLYGMNDIVFVEGGTERGDRLGDEYLITYTTGPEWDEEVEGRLQVVGVQPDHVTARIVKLDTPIQPGGRARLDRRLSGR